MALLDLSVLSHDVTVINHLWTVAFSFKCLDDEVLNHSLTFSILGNCFSVDRFHLDPFLFIMHCF